MLPTHPKYIIAIGASAGGMEEINQFFDQTPTDGVSYVIVQHLSPDFKSRMVELLARHSKLKVSEAEEGMTVETNRVYLTPNKKYMTIRSGKLYLTDKEKQGPHLTINRFFESLALDCGPHAIAVILSGLGSDGTAGIKAVKKEGGLVLARNPETSEFGSMPASAIASGMVDYIFEPGEMPKAIEEYMNSDELLAGNKDDDKNLHNIVTLIKERSPLDFSEYKPATMLRRIKRRATLHEFSGLFQYYNFLQHKPDEIALLTQDLLISVTSFFRDNEAFEFIRTDVLPAIFKKAKHEDEIRFWVAGCATGEEAYSLAMLIDEGLPATLKNVTVKIFATDIDGPALAHAGTGVYNAAAVKDLSAERLANYFIKEGSNYRVAPGLRKMLVFAKHDLVKNPPYCNMDFISCRNVLIYLTPVLQRKIFLMLIFGLKLNGYLFLGSSESPVSVMENLEEVNKKWRIYKNLQANRLVKFDAFSLPEILPSSGNSKPQEAETNLDSTLAEVVNHILISEAHHLALCVNENDAVIKTYGDTGNFLLQKNFTQDITELLPKPLAVAFNTLKLSAAAANKQKTLKSIPVKIESGLMHVTMSITPLQLKKGNQKLILVTMRKDTGRSFETVAVYNDEVYCSQYMLNLETELKEVKQNLKDASLQLNSSNENMQSFNEEIISSNEEMQSVNEELQSVNEELHTINTDYRLKNKELQDVNDDLNNYFRSNVNGQLFVDNNLTLMKFSPGTVKHINLNDGDIGRPLANITTNFKLDTLIADLKEVTASGITLTKEMEDNTGKWYQVMTMPYLRNNSQIIDGAMISFRDVTDLKTTEENLKKLLNEREEFMSIAGHELKTPLTSISGYIQVLKIKARNDGLSEYEMLIDKAYQQANKLQVLINELLDVTKAETGNLKLYKTSFDTGALISDVIGSFKINNPSCNINYNPANIPINADKTRIEQVLSNLLSNAIKYSDSNIDITVENTERSGVVEISVKDEGIGISAEMIPHLFERFFRVDKNSTSPGLGLGLYISNRIIELHNGTISAAGEPGKGTMFTVKLPKGV